LFSLSLPLFLLFFERNSCKFSTFVYQPIQVLYIMAWCLSPQKMHSFALPTN
jgi:hypothetical protein